MQLLPRSLVAVTLVGLIAVVAFYATQIPVETTPVRQAPVPAQLTGITAEGDALSLRIDDNLSAFDARLREVVSAPEPE